MANSTETDYNEMNVIQCLFLFAFSGITLAGLVIQSFIVAVNGMDWLKGRSITDADKIISSIGISRIIFHTAYLLLHLLGKIYLKIPKIIAVIISFTLQSSASSSVWLTTLLSIFFYFKISTFHNIFFRGLKAIISRRVLHLIFASVLFSVLHSSMFYFSMSSKTYKNSTQYYISYFREAQIISYLNIWWTALPLLIFFIASLLLIILLAFHMSRMNNHGNMTTSRDIYHRTMMFTVVSFLACGFYIVIFLFQMCMRLDYSLFPVTINIFPVLHSALLIYVATKLRNQFFRVFHCGTYCLSNRKSPGHRSSEPMEVTAL
ncbi:taste receptor type 2 member 125-like [Mantella aurantiaca]